MADYHVLRIDSLLETLTLCNAGKGFLFQLDTTSEILAQPGDYVLGYVSSPVDEVRYIFEIESASGNSVVLKKVLEVSNGVQYDFSNIEELQPSAFTKEYFSISADHFKSITSQLCRFATKTTGTPTPKYNKPTIQTIYYGCPGTGKSYKVMTETEGADGNDTVYFDKDGVYVPDINAVEDKSEHTTNIFRTTFHPDYDYSTFVGSYKPVMNPVLDEDGKDTGKEDLAYEFVPQVFTNAYVRAWKSLNDDTIPEEKKHVYLIIEEINRGNCAQIFGDLFQLLDRRKDGRSEYFIVPDAELRKYLAKQNLESNKLILPENLHILATMNTSDQSLFPMDSAFKRRWAMEYIPVNLKHDIAKDFTFKVNGKEYSWVKFLGKVNPLIRKATDSEDKQMGEFFIKGKISEEDFKNKVMFYIWNDVCKDLYSASRISPLYFMRSEAGEDPKHVFTFAELFGAGRYEKEEDKYMNPTELLEGFITKQLELRAIENVQE